MNLQAAWEATFTRRWHRNPHLAVTYDPIGGHQGRVAFLALMLFPTAHAVHRAAILHDMGEALVGDMDGQIKEDNPDLKDILDRLEDKAMVSMGIPPVSLDAIEADMLRLCDKLDGYLWAQHHRPDLMWREDWQRARERINQLAAKLRVQGKVQLATRNGDAWDGWHEGGFA